MNAIRSTSPLAVGDDAARYVLPEFARRRHTPLISLAFQVLQLLSWIRV